MIKRIFLLLLVSTFCSLAKGQEIVKCVIETSLGDIEIELYADKAPITVNNFLKYVDEGHYTNSSFYRVCTAENEANREVKIEVIQGGNVARNNRLEPIRLETTDQTGIMHEDGTLSMARTADLHSATSHFFICIGDQPALDFGGKRSADGQGFAAFGKVTKGMGIARKIQAGENTNQRLTKPIGILSIKRVS